MGSHKKQLIEEEEMGILREEEGQPSSDSTNESELDGLERSIPHLGEPEWDRSKDYAFNNGLNIDDQK